VQIIENHPHFFTATIYEWLPALQSEETKRIVIDSLSFLVENGRVKVSAFVIMDNHIHLIWQVLAGHEVIDVQRDFLKYTGQKIKFFLQDQQPALLEKLHLNLADRKYQIWQRNALQVPLFSSAVLVKKLDYIQQNPVRAGLCSLPEEYGFSSAGFYIENKLEFDFLSHYDE